MSAPEKPRCETCRWFDVSTFGPVIGVCRIRSVNDQYFPPRHTTDWCGEHKYEVTA
jgi:hypothetical protein